MNRTAILSCSEAPWSKDAILETFLATLAGGKSGRKAEWKINRPLILLMRLFFWLDFIHCPFLPFSSCDQARVPYPGHTHKPLPRAQSPAWVFCVTRERGTSLSLEMGPLAERQKTRKTRYCQKANSIAKECGDDLWSKPSGESKRRRDRLFGKTCYVVNSFLLL